MILETATASQDLATQVTIVSEIESFLTWDFCGNNDHEKKTKYHASVPLMPLQY